MEVDDPPPLPTGGQSRSRSRPGRRSLPHSLVAADAPPSTLLDDPHRAPMVRLGVLDDMVLEYLARRPEWEPDSADASATAATAEGDEAAVDDDPHPRVVEAEHDQLQCVVELLRAECEIDALAAYRETPGEGGDRLRHGFAAPGLGPDGAIGAIGTPDPPTLPSVPLLMRSLSARPDPPRSLPSSARPRSPRPRRA